MEQGRTLYDCGLSTGCEAFLPPFLVSPSGVNLYSWDLLYTLNEPLSVTLSEPCAQSWQVEPSCNIAANPRATEWSTRSDVSQVCLNGLKTKLTSSLVLLSVPSGTVTLGDVRLGLVISRNSFFFPGMASQA